jgi:hypothetical protein
MGIGSSKYMQYLFTKTQREQVGLERANPLLSFDKTRTAYKKKKFGDDMQTVR